MIVRALFSFDKRRNESAKLTPRLDTRVELLERELINPGNLSRARRARYYVLRSYVCVCVCVVGAQNPRTLQIPLIARNYKYSIYN